MNDAGTAEVPRGMPGELWVRGPIVMKGYWRDPTATREAITKDGWMMTGDVCYIDEDNHFHIVDRKKVVCFLLVLNYVFLSLSLSCF